MATQNNVTMTTLFGASLSKMSRDGLSFRKVQSAEESWLFPKAPDPLFL